MRGTRPAASCAPSPATRATHARRGSLPAPAPPACGGRRDSSASGRAIRRRLRLSVAVDPDESVISHLPVDLLQRVWSTPTTRRPSRSSGRCSGTRSRASPCRRSRSTRILYDGRVRLPVVVRHERLVLGREPVPDLRLAGERLLVDVEDRARCPQRHHQVDVVVESRGGTSPRSGRSGRGRPAAAGPPRPDASRCLRGRSGSPARRCPPSRAPETELLIRSPSFRRGSAAIVTADGRSRSRGPASRSSEGSPGQWRRTCPGSASTSIGFSR